jgi:DNA-binding LacI/PurR family transcriptional regulator
MERRLRRARQDRKGPSWHGVKCDAVIYDRYSTAVISNLSTFRLDPRSGVGIAAQIRTRIAFLIADGELTPGDRLPSVRALARHLGVNVNTVRTAYTKLDADGLVRTKHGVGTVVLAAHVESPPAGGLPLGVNTVAVLVGGLNPFYLSLLRGIEDVAAEQGTLVLITDTRDSPTVAEAMIRRLIARGVDGIIAVSVGGIATRQERDRRNNDRMPPIVYVDQPDRTDHVLLFDAHGAGYAATRHLREHGHDTIGIVTAPLSWPNVREVYEGYAQALADADTPLSPTLIAEVSEFTVDAGRVGLERLLDLPRPPSAVFAAGETLALGVLQEARSRQIDVPGDLAITGYTDSPAAALVEPPLTMVSVPAREIGIQAMRTLSDLIRGRKPRSRRTVLDVELVVRDSCGPH